MPLPGLTPQGATATIKAAIEEWVGGRTAHRIGPSVPRARPYGASTDKTPPREIIGDANLEALEQAGYVVIRRSEMTKLRASLTSLMDSLGDQGGLNQGAAGEAIDPHGLPDAS
jgi:hypothetical protein